ncbi:MAG TPA: hypothetical protein PLF32_02810 [Bacteroidales bacterium]|nr:hypothetical protein [Bacteroidales bacterium]HON20869.1 hypothetical protein [Bacteroidales bacterium]HOR81569.1 hypothetical protein [Bacteroidales bacterium]HPJ90353.1 hypothetical protein [Bacteroidales bacterium]
MKRITVTVLMVIFCFTSINSMAQKKKEFAGTVTFSIKYEGDIDPQKLANAPTSLTYLVAGNNTKLTINGQGYVQHVVSLGDSSQELTIIDHPMQQLIIKKSKEDFEEEREYLKYTITPSDETKTICGYVCKRYDVSIENIEDDSETKIICFTTEEIGQDERINFDVPGLKGYPLYQEQMIGDIKIINEAVEVKKKKIKPVEFLMPANFTVITYDEYIEAVRKAAQEQEDF